MAKRSNCWHVLALRLLLAVVAVGLVRQPTTGEEEQAKEPRLLTSIGNAEIRVRPDQALVRLGVETEAKTATEAREQNAVKANSVLNALKALSIPERQMETAVFQVYPVRRFEREPPRGEPPIVGYRVLNTIAIRTERLDLVPRIVDESVEAGANRVENIGFVLKDEDAARQMALKKAVSAARENAIVMAGEIGVQLAEVRSLRQGGIGVVPPRLAARAGALEADVRTPILPGEVSVNASVTLTYAIR